MLPTRKAGLINYIVRINLFEQTGQTWAWPKASDIQTFYIRQSIPSIQELYLRNHEEPVQKLNISSEWVQSEHPWPAELTLSYSFFSDLAQALTEKDHIFLIMYI